MQITFLACKKNVWITVQYAAVQILNAVSAYYTSELILPFVFAEQSTSILRGGEFVLSHTFDKSAQRMYKLCEQIVCLAHNSPLQKVSFTTILSQVSMYYCPRCWSTNHATPPTLTAEQSQKAGSVCFSSKQLLCYALYRDLHVFVAVQLRTAISISIRQLQIGYRSSRHE